VGSVFERLLHLVRFPILFLVKMQAEHAGYMYDVIPHLVVLEILDHANVYSQPYTQQVGQTTKDREATFVFQFKFELLPWRGLSTPYVFVEK
jgi:hypothetical protein